MSGVFDRLRRTSEAKVDAIARIGAPCQQSEILKKEADFGLVFPHSLRCFYAFGNGFSWASPAFEFYRLEDLVLCPERMTVVFARTQPDVLFELSFGDSNPAGEWTVLEQRSGNTITYTLGSFLSIHVWKWIDHGKQFWTGQR